MRNSTTMYASSPYSRSRLTPSFVGCLVAVAKKCRTRDPVRLVERMDEISALAVPLDDQFHRKQQC